MTGPAPVPARAGGAEERPGERGWLEWLRDHLDRSWRPGEWDQQRWLFTGDLGSDRTAAWPCATPGCPVATRYHHRRCDGCRRARLAAGIGWQEFDATPFRRPVRPLARGGCLVPGCESELHSRGLCLRHERSWSKHKTEPVEAFIARARPLARRGDCAVPGCGREQVSRRGLCRFHDNRLLRQHDVASLGAGELAAWIAAERPLLGAHQFSLAGLPELLRTEFLFALQRRDQAPPPLDPAQVRILLARLAGAPSVREADPAIVCEAGGVQYNAATRGLFRDLRRHLDVAWAAHTGADPFAGEVWQVALLGLQPNPSRRWPATQGVIDFRLIELAWLREIAMHWARSARPTLQRLRETLRACQGPYSASHRNLLLYQFCQVIEHGRGSGLMTEVPDTFRPAGRLRIRQEANEDEIGKALPEPVIRRLDASLHLLGPAGRAGSIPAAELQAMHQVIYQVLRDTGRRPGEVVSLRTGCVEVTGGQHNLIYDNHKAGRMRRRLPITAGTAQIITGWQERRAGLATPPAQRSWLFPSPLLRAQRSHGHLTPAAVARAFKAWVARIGPIDGELHGPDGRPVPFDASLITPYALRHSYAQRHADAGVPVDVLKELMDHVSVTTTMGYYRIGLKRKQQAIRSVGPLATDAAGSPAPFTSPTAYERASVAVPFGNCTEPSNVKAGGGACPIRFQCAGCGFYRPDPSYLPALGQHIASLRADRETALAIGAADYVLANLTAEIDAFAAVAGTMQRRLSGLDPAQRAEVEEASRILRRARAARTLPLTDITSRATDTA